MVDHVADEFDKIDEAGEKELDGMGLVGGVHGDDDDADVGGGWLCGNDL